MEWKWIEISGLEKEFYALPTRNFFLVPTPLIPSGYIIRKRFQRLRLADSVVFEKSCLKVGEGGLEPRFDRGCWRTSTKFDRIFEVSVTHICTYLATECGNHSENITNRKLSIFYIEVMSHFFFQLHLILFFWRSKIFFEKKSVKK